MYCEAITPIDANSDLLTPSWLSEFPKLHEKYLSQHHSQRESWLAIQSFKYWSEVTDAIVPLLQHSCPNLRTIEGGDNPEYTDRGDLWSIHLYPIQPSGLHPIPHGHVDYTAQRRGSVFHDASAKEHHASIMLSDLYRTRYRFNLDFNSSSRYYDEWFPWREAFQNDDHFDCLYRSADFGELSISLDDIITLYQRQINAGHSEWLAYITSRNIQPWNNFAFESLASIASHSLKTLNLLSKQDETSTDDADKAICSFSDLPSIISSIRTHLPNLTEFDLRLQGMETAETTFGDLLTEDTLDQRGPIKSLYISSTSNCDTPLFNTIRYISQICADNPFIYIRLPRDLGSWGRESQKRYLNVLRW